MYQPLIVDDEVLVRIGLINCIDWGKHGFLTPMEAGNGEEAWEILQSNKIDIAIVDIKMNWSKRLVVVDFLQKL